MRNHYESEPSAKRQLRGARQLPLAVLVLGAHDQLAVAHERVLVGHHPHGSVPDLGIAPTVMLPAQLLEGCVEALEVVDVPAVDLGIGAVLAG